MKKQEETHKYKMSKGELATKVMAGILVALMLISVCSTGVYYLYYYLSA